MAFGSLRGTDLKDSNLTACYLMQSGLGLPDRDYYLNDDPKSTEIRAKYSKIYRGDIFQWTSKVSDSALMAKTIIDIETGLARASMTQVELRDYEKQYNKKSEQELAALTPGIDWKNYFAAINIPVPAYAIVCQPKFF